MEGYTEEEAMTGDEGGLDEGIEGIEGVAGSGW